MSRHRWTRMVTRLKMGGMRWHTAAPGTNLRFANRAASTMDHLRTIAAENIAILERTSYTLPDGIVVPLDCTSSVERTRTYTPTEVAELLNSHAPNEQGALPRIEAVEATTQAHAHHLICTKGVQNLCLLNFASARNAGGGYLRGARAQEEDLARCSALHSCLSSPATAAYYEANRQESTKLYTDHIIYSPEVPFFCDERYALLREPFVASVISAPAPNAGAASRSAVPQLYETLRRRAGSVLALARAQGHRTLLLGSWGCGVFRNREDDVACVFDEWLRHPKFRGIFDRVVFAVLVPRSKPQILVPFERIARS